MNRLVALAASVVIATALIACGESAEAKAKKQVCSARNDISKQVSMLAGLTLTPSAAGTAKSSFEAIEKDLSQIKSAQPKLEPARRKQVEAATETFLGQLDSITSNLASHLSTGNAASQFKSALTQLASAYRLSLAPISC